MFKTEWVGKEELLRKLKKFPFILNKHLLSAMNTSLNQLKADVKDFTPFGAVGDLRGSISSKVKPIGGRLVGMVSTTKDYAPYVERGTRPHFPPPSALERWCAIVLGNARLAFVVARAISRRGTRGAKMFEKATKKNLPNILTRFKKALNDALKEVARL